MRARGGGGSGRALSSAAAVLAGVLWAGAIPAQGHGPNDRHCQAAFSEAPAARTCTLLEAHSTRHARNGCTFTARCARNDGSEAIARASALLNSVRYLRSCDGTLTLLNCPPGTRPEDVCPDAFERSQAARSCALERADLAGGPRGHCILEARCARGDGGEEPTGTVVDVARTDDLVNCAGVLRLRCTQAPKSLEQRCADAFDASEAARSCEARRVRGTLEGGVAQCNVEAACTAPDASARTGRAKGTLEHTRALRNCYGQLARTCTPPRRSGG